MPARARRPHLQPYVDAIEGYLRANNLTRQQMAEMIYGRDKDGHPKVGNFHPTAIGKTRPHPATIALIREKTGLDLSTVRPLGSTETIPLTPAKAALAEFSKAQQPSAASAPVRANTRVTMTVTRPTGEAVLSLSDVTPEQAVKLLQSLISSGLA